MPCGPGATLRGRGALEDRPPCRCCPPSLQDLGVGGGREGWSGWRVTDVLWAPSGGCQWNKQGTGAPPSLPAASVKRLPLQLSPAPLCCLTPGLPCLPRLSTPPQPGTQGRHSAPQPLQPHLPQDSQAPGRLRLLWASLAWWVPPLLDSQAQCSRSSSGSPLLECLGTHHPLLRGGAAASEHAPCSPLLPTSQPFLQTPPHGLQHPPD